MAEGAALFRPTADTANTAIFLAICVATIRKAAVRSTGFHDKPLAAIGSHS
jgi:hypothetical protein